MRKSQPKKKLNGRRSQVDQLSQPTSSQLSQLTLNASFSRSQTVENIDELVNKCVRYFLYRAGNNLPIRKTDLQKSVLKNTGKSFNPILEKAKVILNEVYGYDVYLCEDNQNAIRYLIANSLPYKAIVDQSLTQSNDDNDESGTIPDDAYKILIMLVLTHIFMSKNVATEVSLFTFLQSLNIDMENHDLFGNVKSFITTSMVNHKYLQLEVDEITKRVSYSWGPRAEHEVSKHELLKFVCKIYKDRLPKSWTSQYESANKQYAETSSVESNNEVCDAD